MAGHWQSVPRRFLAPHRGALLKSPTWLPLNNRPRFLLIRLRYSWGVTSKCFWKVTGTHTNTALAALPKAWVGPAILLVARAGSEMFPVARRRPDTALSFPDGAERTRSRRRASPAVCNSVCSAPLRSLNHLRKGQHRKIRLERHNAIKFVFFLPTSVL